MNKRTKDAGTLFGGLGVLAAAGAIMFAPGALANPPGCTNAEAGSTSPTGVLTSLATGHCSAAGTRTLVSQVKQDISGGSDRVVASSSEANYYGTSYSHTTSTCDSGRTLNYYGRSYFSVDTTYADSPHTMQHSCT
jgi:hypothetical protein